MSRGRSTKLSDKEATSDSRPLEQQAAQTTECEVIAGGDAGDWESADELKKSALRVLENGQNLTIDLANLSHLDASALQILLATQLEQQKAGREFHVTNVSQELKAWFELAGATSHFSL